MIFYTLEIDQTFKFIYWIILMICIRWSVNISLPCNKTVSKFLIQPYIKILSTKCVFFSPFWIFRKYWLLWNWPLIIDKISWICTRDYHSNFMFPFKLENYLFVITLSPYSSSLIYVYYTHLLSSNHRLNTIWFLIL